MDEDLKELWQSNIPDNSFHENLKALKSEYKNEEKKAFKSKLFASITTLITAAFLVWMLNYYNWTSGIKFYGMLVVIIDIILVNITFWFRGPILKLDESKYSLKELNQKMIKNLNDQIIYNRYILPAYGIFLTVGLLMVYTDLVPAITKSQNLQILIYAAVIIFVGAIMSVGIYRKNNSIKLTIKPLIKELNEIDLIEN